jgi:hypothetical protein
MALSLQALAENLHDYARIIRSGHVLSRKAWSVSLLFQLGSRATNRTVSRPPATCVFQARAKASDHHLAGRLAHCLQTCKDRDRRLVGYREFEPAHRRCRSRVGIGVYGRCCRQRNEGPARAEAGETADTGDGAQSDGQVDALAQLLDIGSYGTVVKDGCELDGFTDTLLQVCATKVQSDERLAHIGAGRVLRELTLAAQDRVAAFIERCLVRSSSVGLRYRLEMMPEEVKHELKQQQHQCVRKSGNGSR